MGSLGYNLLVFTLGTMLALILWTAALTIPGPVESRFAVIQDPATLDWEITELIDNDGEITNEVEPDDVSADTMNIIHTKLIEENHRDNHIMDYGLELSGNTDEEDVEDTEEDDDEGKYKQCL